VNNGKQLSQFKTIKSTSLEPLPSINYHIIRDTDLRKKLNELGIPNSGNKIQLQKRHTHWREVWNANVDSSNPRSKRELLQDLDQWEKSQGARAQVVVDTIMQKEFDRDGYSNSHQNHFKDLVAQARASAKANKATEANAPPPLTAAKALPTQPASLATSSVSSGHQANGEAERHASASNGEASDSACQWPPAGIQDTGQTGKTGRID